MHPLHRLHGVSDAYLGGFYYPRPLGPARPATTGSERLRLAEREASQFLGSIEKAAKELKREVFNPHFPRTPETLVDPKY